MINLSKRLEQIGNIILELKCNGIVDVGCDHALLDIYVKQINEKINIIASDINEKPLEKAKENIIKYSLLNKIELKLCDGIPDITKDIDTLVISGMGCENIIDILEKGSNKLDNIKYLILTSNNKYELLRSYTMKNDLKIINEKIVFDEGKYYIVMVITKGKQIYTKEELYFGPILLKNKSQLFIDYYKNILGEKEQIYKSLPEKYEEKKKQLFEEIEMVKKELFTK